MRKRWSADTPPHNGGTDRCAPKASTTCQSANAEKIVLGWIEEKGYHLGNVMNAFRLAVVGSCRGPHMFDITELMPREEVVARIRRAVDTIPVPEG